MNAKTPPHRRTTVNATTSATSTSTSAPSLTPSRPANVDAAELDKFQSIASRWWDPDSEFAPLHAINPLRLDWISSHVPGGLKDRDAIDVGCGGGILTESLARRGARATGIDLADKSLTVARLHALDAEVPVTYRCVSVEDHAAENAAAYDVVTCMEMLEHVPDPESVVQACARLVRPGGRVFLSTIHRNPKAFVQAIIGAEYLLQLLPRGTHDYARFIKPSELVASARRHGLEPVAMSGLGYNPVTRIYRLLPNDVSVNYMVAFERTASGRTST